MSQQVKTMDLDVREQTSSETQQPKDFDPEPLFTIDTSMHSKKDFVIPIYNQKKICFDKKNDSTKSNNSGYKQNSCWNCGSIQHALNSCPEPRNQRTISKNRQAFMMQKRQNNENRQSKPRSGGHRFTRYYLEDLPCSDKWNNSDPGKLSKKLLKALNVPKNGLPLHIYKMRHVGYPSGWLEEAKVKHSGISLFIDCNKSEPIIGEDGKVDTHDKFKIDMSKLWKYPGFNTPCPPGTIDECWKYNCREFDPNQSIQNMREQLKDYKLRPCRRTKLSFPGIAAKKKVTCTITSSAVSGQETSPCENIETAPEKNVVSSPSSPEEGEIIDSDNEGPIEIKPKSIDISPGLDEKHNIQNSVKLEQDSVFNLRDQHIGESSTKISPEKKLDILKVVKLESDTTVTNSSCDQVEKNEEKGATSSVGVDLKLVKLETPEKIPISVTDPIASCSKRKYGELSNEIAGTPVLKRFSPYANRPAHEKFAKGMVDIIDYKNLPNVIGTFNKLKEIIKDVRTKLDKTF